MEIKKHTTGEETKSDEKEEGENEEGAPEDGDPRNDIAFPPIFHGGGGVIYGISEGK